METFKWQGYEWAYGDNGWDIIHPEKSYCWHDKTCVSLYPNGMLYLISRYHPKEFNIQSDEGIHFIGESQIGVGWIETTIPFTYGYFEIECKFPVGDYMWPAFWLSGFKDWPPEIDIVEGYSGKRGSYCNIKPWKLKFWPLWHVNTNQHYKNPKKAKDSIGAKTHWLGWMSPAKRFYTYAIDWQENYVRWYYNGRMVREITSRSILNTFKGAPMKVIINNHIQDKTNTINHKPTCFTVESFVYRKEK